MRIIDRAVASGDVRGDLTLAEFPLLTCGAIAVMYVKPGGGSDWRRQLERALAGVRAGARRDYPPSSRR